MLARVAPATGDQRENFREHLPDTAAIWNVT
jgi:hypothetical protein